MKNCPVGSIYPFGLSQKAWSEVFLVSKPWLQSPLVPLSSRKNYDKILTFKREQISFRYIMKAGEYLHLAKRFKRIQVWEKCWISRSKREKVVHSLAKEWTD